MRGLDAPALLEAAKAGDNDACERLLIDNSGLIWSVARRYYGRGVDPEDLYQLGCLGFLKAIRGFDTEYGTQFSTYAVPKIAGEIRRFLRDDGAVKVSRGTKERAMALRQRRLELCRELDARQALLHQLGAGGHRRRRHSHAVGGLPPGGERGGRFFPGDGAGGRWH